MNTKKSVRTMLLFVLSGFSWVSCVQNPGENSGNSSVTEMSVPTNFDWATIRSAHLTVIPQDKFGDQYYYTLSVYGENPLFNNAAPLLAQGVTKSGQAFVTDLTLPTATTEIYVRQTDPSGGEILQSVAISASDMVCDFSTVLPNTARKSMPSLRSTEIVVAESTPAGAETLTSTSGDIGWTNNVNYVIPAGETYTGSIALGTNSNLYIEGTYSLSGKKASFSIASGGKLVIQSSGKMQVASDVDLSFHIGQINNYGSLVSNGQFTMTSKSTLYNQGTMTFASFNTTNAENTIVNDGQIDAVNYSVLSNPFTNNGVFNVSGVFEVTSTAMFVNTSLAQVAQMETKSGSVVKNNCHIKVTDVVNFHGSTYNGYNGSLLETQNLTADGTKFMLSEAAMMKAGLAEFSTWRNYINGVGSNYALVRFGEVGAVQKAISKNITYQGNVEVECSNHLTNDKNNPFWVVEGSDVRWAEEGKSTVNIASTGCNDGGNIVVENPEPPVNPNFPIEVNLTTHYTFLMEDNWPWLGDYDLNDLVVDLTMSYLMDKNNQATEMKIIYQLRAAGASKRIAAAFQLDKLSPSQISSVSYSEPILTGTVFNVERGGLETGQTKAVIPLFDDAHLVLNPAGGSTSSLLNTIIKGEYYEPVSDTIRVLFEQPVDPSNISVPNLNFFIVTDGSASLNLRNEVHLSGYKPTNKADASVFGTANDYNLNGASYRTQNNLIWGLLVPVSFQYAAEWRDITTVYPWFTQWCISGGIDYPYWYETPTEKSGFVYVK